MLSAILAEPLLTAVAAAFLISDAFNAVITAFRAHRTFAQKAAALVI